MPSAVLSRSMKAASSPTSLPPSSTSESSVSSSVCSESAIGVTPEGLFDESTYLRRGGVALMPVTSRIPMTTFEPIIRPGTFAKPKPTHEQPTPFPEQ